MNTRQGSPRPDGRRAVDAAVGYRSAGRAQVILKGRQGSFTADVVIAGGFVHGTNVVSTIAGYRRTWPDRAWQIGAVRELHWLDGEDRMAA